MEDTTKNKLKELKEVLIQEGRVLTLDGFRKTWLLGCVHSDLSGIKWALEHQDNTTTAIVVIGDVTCRGNFDDALECLNLLFDAKLNRGNVFVTMHNHCMYHRIPFFPHDFWEHLNEVQYQYYTTLFDHLPYCVICNGIIALHGLPVNDLHKADQIKLGSSEWYTITWGRLSDAMCTRDYIDSVLENNKASLIIRSHDHFSQLFSHYNRVITFTTSNKIPNSKRLVIEVDLTRPVRNHEDVKIIDIDREDYIS